MKRFSLAIAALLACLPLWSQSVPLGEIVGRDHAIRDPLYSWSARYPQDWTVHGVTRWGDRETTLYLGTPTVPGAYSTLYYKSHGTPQPLPADTESALRDEARRLAARRVSNGLNGYLPQPDSFTFAPIGGHPALRFAAHYPSGGRTFCEYVIRVVNARGIAQLVLRVPLAQFEAVRTDFEAMAETLTLP
jgi:hypothetical protein